MQHTRFHLFMPSLIGDKWRIMCIWVTAPSFLFLPVAMCFLRESPRWLLVRGYHDEMQENMLKIAEWNGAVLDPEDLRKVPHVIEDPSQAKTTGERLKEIFRYISSGYSGGGLHVICLTFIVLLGAC